MLSHAVSTVADMSLIDQARDLVKGFVSAEDDYRNSVPYAGAATDPTTFDDVERIRAEWDAQPHHP